MSQNVVSQTWSKTAAPPVDIPAAADVVIIGGGIVGVSTAWFLAKQGIDVVVCEKGHVAGEQSGRNWGWVRVQGRDTREIPMMLKSLELWDQLGKELGEDVGFRRGGCLFTARNASEFSAFDDWMRTADEFSIGTTLLERAELRNTFMSASDTWYGAIYTEDDGRAEPHLAAPAIARGATRQGATILTSCAVRGIERSGGAVSAVVTESGSIRTPTVLCAAGAWSSLFCRSLGVDVPQLRVKGTVARTAAASELFNGNIFDHDLGIRRRQDGGYTIADSSTLEHFVTPGSFRYFRKFLPALMQDIKLVKLAVGPDAVDGWTMAKSWALDEVSPFEKTRVLDPKPNPRVLRRMQRNMGRLFPALKDVAVVESWSGMIESSPDVVPMIDSIDAIPGFHLATGFSGHGFGLGLGAGFAIAGMISAKDTGIDLRPLRLSRFFDGSPIRPQASI